MTDEHTAEENASFAGDSLLTGQEPTDSGQLETDAKAPDGDGQETGQPQKLEAPESYEAFSLPEGMEIDEEILGEFQQMAKEHGLPQDQAQRYVDFGSKLVQQAQEGTVATLSDQWSETCAKWVEEIKADKELGGDNLPQTLAVARKAISTFGDDNLRQVLEETGMTNNPALLRFAHKIGRALLDDTLHTGSPTANAERPPEQVLYPTMLQ